MECANAVIEAEQAAAEITGVKPHTKVKEADTPKGNLVQTILDLDLEGIDSLGLDYDLDDDD
eukprot:2122814-Pyramimonas_sp.AAC.1